MGITHDSVLKKTKKHISKFVTLFYVLTFPRTLGLLAVWTGYKSPSWLVITICMYVCIVMYCDVM